MGVGNKKGRLFRASVGVLLDTKHLNFAWYTGSLLSFSSDTDLLLQQDGWEGKLWPPVLPGPDVQSSRPTTFYQQPDCCRL